MAGSRRCIPKVHGGLLAIRDNKEHAGAMKAHGIAPIDLLVVNLYPFEATVAKGAGFDDCIENIDIGGPAMIRAAAKNHDDVAVIVEPADYAALLDEMKANNGATTLDVAQSASRPRPMPAPPPTTPRSPTGSPNELTDDAPAFRAFGGKLAEALRYGENPHQSAAFYRTPEQRFGVATARQLQGKQLSYNNINDTDAAYECVAEFDPKRTAACVIVKHANPCGVAEGDDLARRLSQGAGLRSDIGFRRHRRAQPQARCRRRARDHGDFHRSDHRAGRERGSHRHRRREEKSAAAAGRRPARPARQGLTAKTVAGGLLVQSRDNAVVDDMELKVVTKRAPTNAELRDLALRLPRGQARQIQHHRLCEGSRHRRHRRRPDEPRSIPRASPRARRRTPRRKRGSHEPLTKGSVVASDAFFPFADGLLVAIEAGATAVIQPGGSMRDDEVIKAADDAGIAMVFTGTRHFRH